MKFWLKSREEFLSGIVNDEKNINEEIFRNYFKHQKPKIYLKQTKKPDTIKYLINNDLIESMEDINIKEIPENENPEKT